LIGIKRKFGKNQKNNYVKVEEITMKAEISNMDQNNLRLRLIDFLKEKGVKLNHIADKTDTPNYILSSFKNGKRNLYDSSLQMLEDFLAGEGFGAN